MDLNEKENSGRTLRDAAEETLSRSSDTMPELKDKTLEEIIQNEELKRVQLELEQYKEKYKEPTSSRGHLNLRRLRRHFHQLANN
jgi:hypothetical protein